MNKQTLSQQLNDLPQLSGQKAIFLLGSDKYIGEGLDEHGHQKEVETRVGLVPEQIEEMRSFLASKGVALDFYFFKGCGARADFLDSAYLNVGGQVVYEHELESIQSPHVVHALKEPTTYEALIPGPFMRIGALHSGAFDQDSGVAFLFKKRNFAAVFDGSYIGEGRNIPIRGAMSVFAGEIASEFAIDHFKKKAQSDVKVVISGGGVVGRASLNLMLNEFGDKVREIVIIEPFEKTVNYLNDTYGSDDRVTVVNSDVVADEHLVDTDALILTAFIKGQPAPNVVQLEQLKNLKDNSIIVDVSIDEKGGIQLPNFKKEDFALPEVVNTVNDAVQQLGKGITYIADDHMPKHKPKKASISHGGAINPYITTLLYYAAKLGGSREASRFIIEGDFDSEPESMREILTHLKNGLAFYNPAPISFNSHIISDPENKENLQKFFDGTGIEHGEF